MLVRLGGGRRRGDVAVDGEGGPGLRRRPLRCQARRLGSLRPFCSLLRRLPRHSSVPRQPPALAASASGATVTSQPPLFTAWAALAPGATLLASRATRFAHAKKATAAAATPARCQPVDNDRCLLRPPYA